ncbi:MAG TPA: ROK family protein [Microvirga sp.]|jgi:predicted NBD/HSP70 family sugar kinase|nr:ROK family protein [Microvirga sp.]
MPTPSDLRAVLEAASRHGPVACADLARITGLSSDAVAAALSVLVAEGCLRPLENGAAPYEADVSRAFVLGVDLGGTKVHAVLADLSGEILVEAIEPTDPRGGRFVTDQIGALMRRLCAEAAVAPERVRGGAVGSPGIVQPDTGFVLDAPNIVGFDRLDVPGALRAACGVPVAVENDVNMAALGEHGGRGASTFAFVALGTGIGMGLIVDGRPVRGARGAAGEIAHLPLGGDPFDPRGHRLGTFETAIGSEAILQRFRALGGAADDVRGVFDALQGGDPAAAAVLDDVARLLLQGLMAIRAVVDPERVVLGGSIGARPELVERVRVLALRHMADPLRIETSALGVRAAARGAVGLALARLYELLIA